jgi:hypothetical protein
VIEIEGVAGLEVQRVLSAFRTEPEPILPAEHIHVWLPLTGGNRGTTDPSEARWVAAARRTRHHASLIGRRYDDLRARPIGQDENLRVLTEKRNVSVESPGWCEGGWRARAAARDSQTDDAEKRQRCSAVARSHMAVYSKSALEEFAPLRGTPAGGDAWHSWFF